MNLGLFRDQFPALTDLTWLATPSIPPAATPVTKALHQALDDWTNGEASWPRRDEAAQQCRHQIADLLGVAAKDVALMQSMAEAAATVAASLRPGDRVVVGAQEYRSNLFPWLATEHRGVQVVQVPMPEGRLTAEALTTAIEDGTTLVAVSEVQSATGWRTDLTAVAARCREVGAQLFVDATQSAGVLIMPEAVSPDYIAVHGYKWLLGPRGAAWLYVRPDRLDALNPLAPNPKATPHPWRDFYGGPLSYAPDARKLDMSLSWPTWIGATAALDLIGALDRPELERHCLNLAQLLRDGTAEHGLKCLPSELPSHIVTLAVPDADAALKELTAHGVRATARAGALRFGFHGFNTPDDVSRLLTVLARTA